ncbi:MAG: response regulator transcription factor [Pseudonocardiales bacterium]|nr:response regulator transcription factor [Pseudonocardiales bacterium]
MRRTAGVNNHLTVVLAMPGGSQRRLDSAALVRHGLRVVAVSTTVELRRALDRACPNLAVVDTAIVAGCRASALALVRDVNTPLIAVAVPDPAVRVALLLAGMADCLSRPYTSEELAARVIAIGRRIHRAAAVDAADVLRAGTLALDLRARRVQVHGTEVALTAMEFNLLGCFLRHPGEVLSRERLLVEVWGYPSGAVETVTVHVRRLRTKVESDPSRPELIQTIWGIGYRLRVADVTGDGPGVSQPECTEQRGAMSAV